MQPPLAIVQPVPFAAPSQPFVQQPPGGAAFQPQPAMAVAHPVAMVPLGQPVPPAASGMGKGAK